MFEPYPVAPLHMLKHDPFSQFSLAHRGAASHRSILLAPAYLQDLACISLDRSQYSLPNFQSRWGGSWSNDLDGSAMRVETGLVERCSFGCSAREGWRGRLRRASCPKDMRRSFIPMAIATRALSWAGRPTVRVTSSSRTVRLSALRAPLGAHPYRQPVHWRSPRRKA